MLRKICYKCKECKEEKDYYDYSNTCKECLGIIGKERRIANIEKRLYEGAKRRAEERGLDFEIEISDIKIPEYCPVLGIKLEPCSEDKGRSPSIDRIDNNGGYTKENIKIISYRANSLKSDATTDELLRIVKYMEGKINLKNKLLDEEVLEIKRLLKKGWSQRKLAQKFSVSQPLIRKIKKGDIWTHIVLEE